MDVIFRDYQNARHPITYLYIDNEFQPLLAPIAEELQVQMHFATAKMHVAPAERNHRIIKERLRTI